MYRWLIFISIIFLPCLIIVLTEISRLLQCPLDRETIALAAGLLERGANPEALAALVVELNCEAQRHQV